MSARRTLALARRILRGVRRDRRTLAMLFAVPVVVLSLLGYMIRGGAANPDVTVVNQDAGVLGAAVSDALMRSSQVNARSGSEPQAEADLASARIAGYVLLPPDFTQSALLTHQIAPQVHLEGTQPALNAAVLGALNGAIANAARRVTPGAPSLRPAVTYLHAGASLDTLDFFGAAYIALVVFFLVYVLTSIAFLRERTQGTLERLMASPLRRVEIVLGYMLGFGVLALAQAAWVLIFALYILHVHNSGSVALVFLFDALLALGAVNLGIFFSTFARTEFQAVQFIPLVVLPQFLLSGVIFPIATEPAPLQPVSDILPLTYAVDGMRGVMLAGRGFDGGVLADLGVALAFAAGAVALAGLTLRRRLA